MSPSIRVDDDVYGFLQRNAEAFVDTPNSVLRRLLNLGERGDDVVEDREAPFATQRKGGRRAARRGKSRATTRARPGTILSHDAYVRPILEVLATAGGQAPARDVIAEVGRRLSGSLTAKDLEPLPSGSIRWENRVQFVRLRLADEGLLARDTARGIWGLTPAGKKLVAEG